MSRFLCLVAVVLLVAGCKNLTFPLDWSPWQANSTASHEREAGRAVAEQDSRVASANRLLLAEGQSLESEGKFQPAAAAYQRILKNSPQNPAASHRLAVVYSRLGRLDEAAELFETTLSAEPDSAVLHCDAGYFYYLREQWDDAETHFRRAVDLEPEFARAHNNLGMLLARQEKYEEAQAAFRRAGCSEGEAENNLAFASLLEQRWDDATGFYERALEKTPHLDKAANGLKLTRQITARPAAKSRTEESRPSDEKLPSPIREAKAKKTPVTSDLRG
jgi:Tfp pilus assembly protein PilF